MDPDHVIEELRVQFLNKATVYLDHVGLQQRQQNLEEPLNDILHVLVQL